MKLPKAWKIALSLLVAAAVGYGSFWGTHTLRGSGGSGAEAEVSPTPVESPGGVTLPPDADQQIAAERTRPRFVGEILGFYIAPDESLIPETVKEKAKAASPPCTGSRLEPSWPGADKLNLSFQLPTSYVLDPAQSGVIVCNDDNTPRSAVWHYNTQFNGYPGYLEILHTDIDVAYTTTLNVAADRVTTITAGGRAAIFIEPILPETGYGGGGAVLFSEPGFTSIGSFNVPRGELLKVADIVGQALAQATR